MPAERPLISSLRRISLHPSTEAGWMEGEDYIGAGGSGELVFGGETDTLSHRLTGTHPEVRRSGLKVNTPSRAAGRKH